MSYTEIYCLGKNPGLIGETKNSHRGAMFVWNYIAEKYFGLKSFPLFGSDKERKKVWNAATLEKVPPHEKIVLISTMDSAYVKAEDIQILIEAFEKFGAENPNSSYLEQAQLIKNSDIGPGDLVAWNQTSVNCNPFLKYNKDDPDSEEYIDIEKIGFDIIEEYNEIIKG